MGDARRFAPATERNREPIADVLRAELPARGRVLEVASGTGEHVVHFARVFPGLVWQPSDPDPDARESIAAWRAAERLDNVLAPMRLDAAAGWPPLEADAILCINMVHISAWSATEGLMRGAGAVLDTGAPLILYGPYRRAGVPTAPSNEAFEASLKARDPAWGLREVEAVEAEARASRLLLARMVEMPANNLILVFRKE